eukprot:2447274-Pleurochrysis_carterae.AAC.3
MARASEANAQDTTWEASSTTNTRPSSLVLKVAGVVQAWRGHFAARRHPHLRRNLFEFSSNLCEFNEIELSCPFGTCATQERFCRWRLHVELEPQQGPVELVAVDLPVDVAIESLEGRPHGRRRVRGNGTAPQRR